MKVPFLWLKDYVDIDLSAEELAAKLFSCGFEVEELIYLGAEMDRIVTARIVKLEKHPDADKLQICQMDCGKYGACQIVTGATNVFEGAVVPACLDKSTLPGGRKITAGKLRGVVSEGMLCSGEELKITDADIPGASVDGILILDPKTPLGVEMREILGLDEYVFDIGVTANRPDCQSVYGIAREVAAVLCKPLKEPALDFAEGETPIGKLVKVRVEAEDLCPRYLAGGVTGIRIAPSPAWMQKRLKLCGLRAINNIVDITNFVLLELGQPMHAFDERELTDRQIVVRRAKEGEHIVTLDGKDSQLNENMLVICDAKKPVALAGIMGGLESGIKPDTAAVVFESARFKRDSIRKTSKALGIRSDSSARYEKGVDSFSPEFGLKRALHLICELGCGKVAKGIEDRSALRPEVRTLKANKADIDALLGLEIPLKDTLRILNGLQIETSEKGGVLTCRIPPWREDLEDYPDIAEEMIRMYGYDHLHSTLLAKAQVAPGGRTQEQKNMDRLKEDLRYQGLHEIVSYAFISREEIGKINLGGEEKFSRTVELLNPLSEDIAVMRTTMLCGLLEAASVNLSRKVEAGRLFETGRIFLPKESAEELPEEKERLGILLFGEGESFFILKGILENLFADFGLTFECRAGGEAYFHPHKKAEIFCKGLVMGSFGELHPDVTDAFDLKKKLWYAEIDLEALNERAFPKFVYKNLPKFPAIERDLALVADEEVSCKAITDLIRRQGGGMLEEVTLFDLYQGDRIEKGKKSMAFRLSFRAEDRTLKVEEADQIIQGILAQLTKKLNVTLRA